MTDIRMLRLDAVLDRRGTSRSQHYRDITKGLCTPPVRVGERAAAWPAHEIDAILRARIAGLPDSEIRELVTRLIAQRTEQRAAA